MSIVSIPKKSHVSELDGSSQKQPSGNVSSTSGFGQQLKPHVLEYERTSSLLHPLSKTKEINRTYVVSACNKLSSALPAYTSEIKMTLQRGRAMRKGESNIDKIHGSDSTLVEERLTLQPRIVTRSTEKSRTNNIYEPKTENAGYLPLKGNNAPFSSKGNNSDILLIKATGKTNYSNVTGNVTPIKPRTPATSKNQNEISRLLLLTTTTPNGKISALKTSGKFSKSNGMENRQNNVTKNEYLERQKTPRKNTAEVFKSTVQYAKTPATSALKSRMACFQVSQKESCGAFTPSKMGKIQENTTYAQPAASVKEDSMKQNVPFKDNPLKIENSKVTVAVRVRPFSFRDRNEESVQVVSMEGQETVVHHPSTKQIYSFAFDFSFWSFDKSLNYASQEKIYQSLAMPLLETAFEGYNACLFAYGQTGSGKSYTMMGFDDDERGIIPRFCQNLFYQIAEKETEQTTYHLEISYFEVYNEKIHDLLIFRAENGEKKQPLRVREHPVFGPYVEDLTANAVSSYSDIQNWLQLGNKHRATAATGMNDKSSRSHSVFTLVMTQTKAEIVEKKEYEHRIISRVNLVDLAGSERCSTGQTSGERLKEGASINKSLLTLGKVISALSEQNQSRKKLFVPYRDSVLTWLLKESLGGNSKTSMIATISPAASNVEETLSTLRYAKQACFIINTAKVNEDMNMKLIQELKAEIEKLKLAQKNVQNVDPEKQRLYVQEITSLRMKLHHQEWEMAEMQRAWKEKFEQVEKKKFEETRELQKAGITFKVDNSLPNLVNLNEDPQLSEMLLYMIKEGETTVGKCKPNSCHDIQLSGILIADDHCIIRHKGGVVSILSVGEAKTYVNGECISGATLLHHGDRIILGGDHYFRFNHPAEVQKIKSLSCGTSFPEEGPKDFEFAKNELLAAQRAQLESEIEEARLKAKEEMMQGIQLAKEMAQEELSAQQQNYETKIKSLEARLEEESHRKQLQEMNNQMAANKIEELEKAKRGLELEVNFNKKRWEIETLAAREVLEDHTVCHVKILEALEAEKQKIAQEVEILQQSQGNRNKEPNWDSLKLSMMLREANTISSKLDKHTVFCRHDVMAQENGLQVQVRNIRLGVATYWSLEKFEDKLAAMKDAYEMNSTERTDEIFYDPTDEWEPDFSNASSRSNSTRRSRSLRKSKRISGCLSGIKVKLHNSCVTGATDTLANLISDPHESFVPGICKELLSSALDVLGQVHEEESMAQIILKTLITIYTQVTAMIKVYEQAEENPENFFTVDQAAQFCSIAITSAFQQLVVLTNQWLKDFRKNNEFVKVFDELREDVKHLGGYLQLLFQGGCADLSSVVAEAEKKIKQILKHLAKYIGHLAAVTGSELSFTDGNRGDERNAKKQFMPDICDGIDLGLRHLLDYIQKTCRTMQKEFSKWYPQNEVQNQIKYKAIELAKHLEEIMSQCKKNEVVSLLTEEDSVDQELKKAHDKATEFLEFQHCLDQVHQMIIHLLEGAYRNKSPFRFLIKKICTLTGSFTALYPSPTLPVSSTDCPLHEIPPVVNQDELNSVAQSLIISFELEERQNSFHLQDGGMPNAKSQGKQFVRGEPTNFEKRKTVPKKEYKLSSIPENLRETLHWV
ncbi:kinesin-like protein KIF14 isoform X1 [Pantherophis guttatus]|uniref:Kinesin-like protein KIF14 n=1 Tax=Pantherophis guttatus TaxID=94885 RepID=A0A6P9DAH4_PANGU|nr:kinesin-like protein KIF14 isoform X1 [Pantherophis guttatus]XP_034293323.1 kinesin-like protein KIF14 isoform X1 [Pantherophis guttatus]